MVSVRHFVALKNGNKGSAASVQVNDEVNKTKRRGGLGRGGVGKEEEKQEGIVGKIETCYVIYLVLKYTLSPNPDMNQQPKNPTQIQRNGADVVGTHFGIVYPK